jgi:hypothetical protein
MKERVFVLLLITCLLLPFYLFTQSRGVRLRIKNLDSSYEVGKQYLVLIAINRYKNWRPLYRPVKDAEEIREVLEARYYIDEVVKLYNEKASKKTIMDLFEDLQKRLKENDSVLIFYAGHGYLHRASNNGFWIPADGGADESVQERWIPNTVIRGLIGNMKSKHTLLISDSCFSGNLLDAWRDKGPTINNEYYKKAYNRYARQVITSGASESVPDRSNFANQLRLVLKENDKPYLSASMLYDEVCLGIKDTFPMFGALNGTNHQKGGAFLLFLRHIHLRNFYRRLNVDEVKATIKVRGFFDRDFNQYRSFRNKYELKAINGNQLVVDHTTGLMWPQSGSSNSMKYNEAKKWIKKLNRTKYAGFNDWRFPTLEEGASLLEGGRMNDYLYIDRIFSNAQRYIWTGDTFVNELGSEAVWVVFFSGGCVHICYPYGCAYVRPVRSLN